MKILIVASHPDDEILGCGGTVSRLVEEGHEAYTLILGEGITSRDDWSSDELKELKGQIVDANRKIGVEKGNLFVYDYPDNSFDTVPFLDIVKTIERIKDKVKPEIIFTHFRNDLNIDHRITYSAVITATRPLQNEAVNQIYSFEVLSSTEWGYPLSFSPNLFFDITKTVDKKIEAMHIYKNEIRKLPHPRSEGGILLNARQWGMKVGLESVEAFEVVRDVRRQKC